MTIDSLGHARAANHPTRSGGAVPSVAPEARRPDLDQVIDTPPSRADVTPEWCVGSPHTSPRARRQATPFQRQRCTHASNWVCCQVFQKSACGTLAPSASR